MKTSNLWLWGVVLLLVTALAGVAVTGNWPWEKNADHDPQPMTFEWDPPVGGSAVVLYEVEIRESRPTTEATVVRRTTDTNRVTFDVRWLYLYEVRVRGVDAEGRKGPWSEWSDPPVDRDHNEPEL